MNALRVSAAVPVFVIVTGALVLVLAVTLPSASVVVDKVIAGARPTPDSAMFCAPVALLGRLSVATKFPAAVGANSTVTVQEEFTARDAEQVLLSVKRLPLAPVIVNVLSVTATVPVLDTVS